MLRALLLLWSGAAAADAAGSKDDCRNLGPLDLGEHVCPWQYGADSVNMTGQPPFAAGCLLASGRTRGINVVGFVKDMFGPRGFQAKPVVNKSFKGWVVHGPGCGGAKPDDSAVPEEWREASARGELLFADSEAEVRYHAMLGNGVLGLETSPGAKSLFIAGVFSGPDASHVEKGEKPTHRASVWNPAAFAPAAPFAGSAGAALDMQRGVYIRRSRLPPTATQPSVLLEQRAYASRATGSLLMVEYEATWKVDNAMDSGNGYYIFPAHQKQSVEVAFEVSPLADFEAQDFDASIERTSITLPTTDGGMEDFDVTVWRGTTRVVEETAKPVEVAFAVPSHATAPFTDKLFNGHPRVVIACFRTSLDAENPGEEALKELTWAMTVHRAKRGYLWRQHVDAWQELWRSGFRAEGRSDVTKVAKSSAYYMLSSMRPERPFSLSPGGLASNGYSGHTFWDAETWMFPPILAWYPDYAKSMMHYRWTRLGAAVRKALSYDPPYAGAMFPWESAASGVEACPPWADTGHLEQHISADIALAARQFYRMTGDAQWLSEQGYDLVSKIAEFWVSRAEPDDQGRWHIRNVVPPDEFAHGVDDSPYTNFAAKQALLFAGEAAVATGKDPDPRWEEVANGLVILLDEATQRHPEHEGYQWGKTIKQADVVLLPYPLGMEMTKEQRLNDLREYAAVTAEDGPAMTWGMHALGYIEVGDDEQAAVNFNRSFANVKQPFDVWTETPKGGIVNFITGAGGFLQTVIFGYVGLRILEDRITLAPKLLEGATSMELRGVWYRDTCFSVSYDDRSMSFTLLEGQPLQVTTAGGARHSLKSFLDLDAVTRVELRPQAETRALPEPVSVQLRGLADAASGVSLAQTLDPRREAAVAGAAATATAEPGPLRRAPLAVGAAALLVLMPAAWLLRKVHASPRNRHGSEDALFRRDLVPSTP